MLIITRLKNKKIKTDIEKAHKAQKESTHQHTHTHTHQNKHTRTDAYKNRADYIDSNDF